MTFTCLELENKVTFAGSTPQGVQTLWGAGTLGLAWLSVLSVQLTMGMATV